MKEQKTPPQIVGQEPSIPTAEPLGKMVKPKPRFAKAQVRSAKQYQAYQDALQVILGDDEHYSLSQVDGLITKFMKGKVN